MEKYRYYVVQITIRQASAGNKPVQVQFIILSQQELETTEIVSFMTNTYTKGGAQVLRCDVTRAGSDVSELFPGTKVITMQRLDLGEEVGENIKRIEEATRSMTRSHIVEEIVQMRDQTLAEGEPEIAAVIQAVAQAVYNKEAELIMQARQVFSEAVEEEAPRYGYINLGKDMGKVQ